jgi:uroporphyrinogen decarboxylase
MNSREIIKRNINFDSPERIGLRFNSLGVSDVFRIYTQPTKAFIPAGIEKVRMDKKIRTPHSTVDEWGCCWDSAEETSEEMGQVLNPPLKNLDDISGYNIPDPYDPDRFSGVDEALQRAEGKFVQLNSPFCMFERMHFIHGFEATLADLVIKPEESEVMLDKLIDFQIGIAEMAGKMGKGRIDCFDTTDDWGTQKNLFINPKLWRKVFKPRYKKLIDVIHNNGMVIRFHSDGKINEIIDDLIEIGVDILNVHQPLLVGIDEISEKFQGKVCFEVSVDIQSTLPGGTQDVISAQAKELVERWATPKGGMIAIEYRYGTAIGVSQQALQWELEAFQKYGVFPNNHSSAN